MGVAVPSPSFESTFHAVRSPVLTHPKQQQRCSDDRHDLVGCSPLPSTQVQPRPILYTSVLLALLQSTQYGWANSQLNLSTFHDKKACDARPVADDTCVMFPGHSMAEWTLAVNAWLVGGMIASLGCGPLSDRVGRKRTHLLAALIAIVAVLIEVLSSSVLVFSLGRFVTGLSNGLSTSVTSGYINEVSAPHLRNKLGILLQASQAFGSTSVVASFFVADSATGWRVIAAVPLVLATTALLLSPRFMVESPTWLLTQGRYEEAEAEIAKLYGEANVPAALSWMDATCKRDDDTTASSASSIDGPPTWRTLFLPAYRRQTALAVALAVAQQFSGANAVFLYSSSIFTDAGVRDDRIGTMLVNVCNLLPTLVSGVIATRFGQRVMMLFAHAGMIVCALGMTLALLADSAGGSIVFTALYIVVYATSLGPLVFVIVPALFPDTLRATGTAFCLAINCLSILVVGITYPYIADAIGDLGFVPFIVTLALFGMALYRFLPETSGLTSEQIQELFRRGDDDEELPTAP
ncbi:hypothetical protein ATCC90586_003875 [Pythium insidiosum]|nr:hypothetical protein ATCC90586_003875 [Pythium insidiosum]